MAKTTPKSPKDKGWGTAWLGGATGNKDLTTHKVRVTKRKSQVRRRLRKVPKPTELERAGTFLLETAQEILSRSSMLDTAVRDTVAQGLAYIVHAGNDCLVSGKSLPTMPWLMAIDGSTEEWFRSRGFVPWFCRAAASLFHTSYPRELVREPRVVVHRGSKKKES
jgi:hypothetical protein